MILMLGIDVPSDSIKGPHRSRRLGQRGGPTLVSRAIERGHAMRTDGEIDRLSEMPADSINLPPGKRGTSARPAVAALRLGYINHATGRKRAWQLLARLRHSKTADGLPLLGEERSCNGRRT